MGRVVAVVVGAVAARTSRWYITSAFMTFLVFVMLVGEGPEQASAKVEERVGETVIGVGLALLFGIAVPALVARIRRP